MLYIVSGIISSIIFSIIAIFLFTKANKKVITFDAKIKKIKCIKGNAKIDSNTFNSYHSNNNYRNNLHVGNQNTNVEMYEKCSIEFEYNQKDLYPELKSKKKTINLKNITSGPYFKNEIVKLEADLPKKNNIRICCTNYWVLWLLAIIFGICAILCIISIFINNNEKKNLNNS